MFWLSQESSLAPKLRLDFYQDRLTNLKSVLAIQLALVFTPTQFLC